MWVQTRHALNFFNDYLPYWEMQNRNELIAQEGAYGLALNTETYALFFPKGTRTWRFLSENDQSYQVQWFNPRTGGDLQQGSVTQIEGRSWHDLGQPPAEAKMDWVVLLKAE
jgi:hypothetical protein